MSEPRCPLCRLLTPIFGARLPIDDVLRRLKTAQQVHCFCPDVKHTPLVHCPHTRPGCIGYTPPAIEIVGTVDSYGEEHR